MCRLIGPLLPVSRVADRNLRLAMTGLDARARARIIEARLFGQPAMTATALAAVALRQRCSVIPARIDRLGPARLRMVVEPPLRLPDTGNRAADQAALTQQINDVLERWIRAHPESWLWLHRRWPKELTNHMK